MLVTWANCRSHHRAGLLPTAYLPLTAVALLAAARCSRRHSVCLPACLSDSYSLPQWSAKTTKQSKAAIKGRVSTVVQSITASRIKGLRCRTGSIAIQVGITHSYHTHIHCIHPPIPAGVLTAGGLACYYWPGFVACVSAACLLLAFAAATAGALSNLQTVLLGWASVLLPDLFLPSGPLIVCFHTHPPLVPTPERREEEQRRKGKGEKTREIVCVFLSERAWATRYLGTHKQETSNHTPTLAGWLPAGTHTHTHTPKKRRQLIARFAPGSFRSTRPKLGRARTGEPACLFLDTRFSLFCSPLYLQLGVAQFG